MTFLDSRSLCPLSQGCKSAAEALGVSPGGKLQRGPKIWARETWAILGPSGRETANAATFHGFRVASLKGAVMTAL